MKLILSADANWGVGRDNELLFRVKEDMKRFRKITYGKTVIMGRKTFESLPGPRPLPNRVNIVLTTDKSFMADGVEVCGSIEELLERAKKCDGGDLYVIGGAQVYNGLLPYCDAAYVTRFFAEAKADSFAPDFDRLDGWSVAKKSGIFKENGLPYQFLIYKRIT